MLLASGLTVAALCMAGVSASATAGCRGEANGGDRAASHCAPVLVTLGAILIPLQSPRRRSCTASTRWNTSRRKIAAMEGNLARPKKARRWCCSRWPNEKDSAATTSSHRRSPSSPRLILTHKLDGELKGLSSFKGDKGYEHPPVAPVFFAFRIMVGIGMLMLAGVSWVGLWLYRRHRWAAEQAAAAPVAGACTLIAMTFSGWIATARRLVRHRDRPPALAW